jgi:hypothetical protein
MANTQNVKMAPCDKCGLMYRRRWKLKDGIYCYRCYRLEQKEKWDKKEKCLKKTNSYTKYG